MDKYIWELNENNEFNTTSEYMLAGNIIEFDALQCNRDSHYVYGRLKNSKNDDGTSASKNRWMQFYYMFAQSQIITSIDIFDEIQNTFQNYVRCDDDHFIIQYTNQTSPGQTGGGVFSHKQYGPQTLIAIHVHGCSNISSGTVISNKIFNWLNDLIQIHMYDHLFLRTAMADTIMDKKQKKDLFYFYKHYFNYFEAILECLDDMALAFLILRFVASQPCLQFCGHKGVIHDCVFMGQNNEYLLSVSDDKTVIQWDLFSGEKIHTFSDHELYVTCIKVSQAEPNIFYTGSWDQTVRRWNINTKQNELTYTSLSNRQIWCLDISKDNNIIYSGGQDGVHIFDIQTGEIILHKNVARLVIFTMSLTHDDTKLIVSGAVSSGNNIYILDAKDLNVHRVIKKAHSNYVYSCKISMDGKYLHINTPVTRTVSSTLMK